MTDSPTFPVLNALAYLFEDDSVFDFTIDGHATITVNRRGDRPQEVESPYRDDNHLLEEVTALAESLGVEVSEANPLLEMRLPDGTRVHVALPPVAIGRPLITVMKFPKPLHLDDLLAYGSLNTAQAELLQAAVSARLNIIVSGSQNSGVTTFYNVLAGFIPDDERVITVERSAELELQHPRVVGLECRQPGPDGNGMVRMRDLIQHARQMLPQRILAGETVGPEAFEMLQVMQGGYNGSMLLLHAENPLDALERLKIMCRMHQPHLDSATLWHLLTTAPDLLLHLDRLPDGTRRLTHITEIQKLPGGSPFLREIFRYTHSGVLQAGKLDGTFEAINTPSDDLVRRCAARGITLPR